MIVNISPDKNLENINSRIKLATINVIPPAMGTGTLCCLCCAEPGISNNLTFLQNKIANKPMGKEIMRLKNKALKWNAIISY